MKLRGIFLAFASIAVMGLVVRTGSANTINLGGGASVTVEASSSSPGVTLENVLLNGSVTQSGSNTLLAHFNGENANVATVKFISTENLTGSGGQASFLAQDNLLNYFKVELVPNTSLYGAIQVNLDYANLTGGPKDSGQVVVSGLTTAGLFTAAAIPIDSSGQNFILGTSSNTAFLWVDFTITGVDPSSGGLADVAQVRIGRTTGGFGATPVPLPAAVWSGGALIVGLAAVRRMRRKTA